MVKQIYRKFDHIYMYRCHHAEHFTLCQKQAKSNGFGDICEKLLSAPYVLFLVRHVFGQIQNPPHQFYAEHPKEH